MFKLSKIAFGPLHFFTAGGLTTFAVLKAIKLLAKRSKTVETVLHKGFDVVEGKIDDLKDKVLPTENSHTA